MIDPGSIAIGAVIGGVAGKFVEKAWNQGEKLIKIPIEEAGEPGICTPISFRATQLAIAELWGREIPQRMT